MVLVPASRFSVGTPEHVLDDIAATQHYARDWFEDESPMVEVETADFLIDRTPVTNAAFTEFVRATRYRTVCEERGFGLVYGDGFWEEIGGTAWNTPAGPGSSVDERPDHPVVHIALADAQAYAAWACKRLPTESEWELAARGTTYRKWPWGDEWDPSRANTAEYWTQGKPISDNSQWREWWREFVRGWGGRPIPGTTPVGLLTAGNSPFGLADVAGNVQEWTATTYSLYDPAAEYDPIYAFIVGKYTVVRGGCWMNFRSQVRCAERVAVDATYTNFTIGFRCARWPEQNGK